MKCVKNSTKEYADSQTAYQKPGILKFYVPFNERTLKGQNLVGISKKREKELIKQEIKSVHIGYLN